MNRFLRDAVRLAVAFAMIAAMITLAIVMTPKTSAQQGGKAIVVSSTDITGDGAAHKIQASGFARWIQINCSASNASLVRVGDVNVSSSRGAPLVAGGGVMLPPIPSAPQMAAPDQYYNMGEIYYFAATGDKISIIWGK